MSKNNSKSSHAQRILYTKKGLRRKVYKEITKILLDYGIDKSRIDEAIDSLKSGKIKIKDTVLMEKIRLLSDFDAAIERLTNELNASQPANQG